MRTNIVLFIGFLLIAAVLIIIDYLDKNQLNLSDNIFQALLIIVIMKVMFWFTNRNKKTNQ